MKPPESINIGGRQTDTAPSQFRPADIAYILFRHKWKILFFSISGIAAAAFFYLRDKPVYVSEAKLLIRYVQETRSVGPMDASDSIKSPDNRGDNILNSEIELLTSLDLAEEVARSVGVTNVMREFDKDPNASAIAAASVVRSGLKVDAPRKSNVLRVTYEHRDPEMARVVLTNLTGAYLRMHARVHRALGVLDDLQRQSEVRRFELEKVETELREIKATLGIANVEEAKKALEGQLSKVREDMWSTEALLAEARATVGRPSSSTNQLSNAATNPAPAVVEIPREKITAYESTLAQIDALKKRQQDLLLQYTVDSIFVTTLRDRIRAVEAERTKMESETPGIANHASTPVLRSTPGGGTTSSDRSSELARVAGLEARFATLQRQFAQVQSDLAKFNAKEPDITQLETKRALYEKDYRFYASALEEARVDAALTSGRIANISVVQAASPPARETEKLKKLVAGALAGGLIVGLGLAALLEFYGDQSVRRPIQVAKNLNIPIFLTVPRLKIPEPTVHRAALPPAGGGTAGKDEVPEELPSDSSQNPLMAYAEALRDRVIMHFQIRELHHKPKLIGITSCGRGAGATTVATTLASSLSETGEGNVLYIDANPDLGPSVQAFYRGKQAAGIASALDHDARSVAKVNDNFYMAALNDTGVAGKVGVLPKKLANLLPKMKASDFDYIIFDLPPVTQTSATARVAGLLDMTLLVLESEKTHGDLAKQVTGLLKQSRADVAAVLNKHRRYLPQRLDPDL